MWFAVWFIAFVDNEGNFQSDKLTSALEKFSTQQECTNYIQKYKDHMPDFVRGFENLNFDNEVRVAGACEEDKEGKL